jgi:hypothetical protein
LERFGLHSFNGTPGAGQGYVDEFDSNGNLLLRLQQGAWMNQPWGVARAPRNFGVFSNALLVAMTGNGAITVFNPNTGQLEGVLRNSSGRAIINSGIHGIAFGTVYSPGPPTRSTSPRASTTSPMACSAASRRIDYRRSGINCGADDHTDDPGKLGAWAM